MTLNYTYFNQEYDGKQYLEEFSYKAKRYIKLGENFVFLLTSKK